MLSFPLDQAFFQAIEQKTFSGAQVLLGQGDKSLFQKSFGTTRFEGAALPVTETTLFDIASLTKPVCTTTLMMLAIEAGAMGLEDSIQKFLPQFNRPEKITLRELLAHTSGLPDWLPLYEAVDKTWTQVQVQEYFISQINQIPLRSPVEKTRLYSDLGFMLLGFALEKVYSKKLDILFEARIAQPLEMKATLFNPLSHSVPTDQIAATESCPWRQRVLQGEVHDDNAFVLGGVAGQAGLFSNTSDLEKFILLILNTWQGKETFLKQATLKKFVEEKLGWDLVSPTNSQAGKYFSPKTSIGHLAFTGCSLWIDLADKKHITLLTNRVHPSRNNEEIKKFRPQIHDLLIQNAGLV